MTRQFDIVQEERTKKVHLAIVKAIEYELVGSVAHQGGELTGFSVRIQEWETLITLRALQDEVPMVAFVGSETLTQALLKCVREAYQSKLNWQVDAYAN